MQQLPHGSISMISKKDVLQQETAHFLKKLCLLRCHYLTLGSVTKYNKLVGFLNL